MQKKLYQITDKVNSRKITEFLIKDGQLLLPFLDLICNTEKALNELIDLLARNIGDVGAVEKSKFTTKSATVKLVWPC